MLHLLRPILRPMLIGIALVCATSSTLRADKLGRLFVNAATTDQGLLDSVKDIRSRAGDFVIETVEESSNYMLLLLERSVLPNRKTSILATLSVREGDQWRALCSIDNGNGALQTTWAMAAKGLIGAAEKCVREPATRRLLPPSVPVAASPSIQAEAPRAQKPAKLTNESVKDLAEAGLGDEIVIAKIRTATDVAFDLSTDALLALKSANVSGAVIAAMIDRDARPSTEPRSRTASPETIAPTLQSPCSGIELMGLFKNEVFDRSMGGGVVEWLAKIRNNTNVTKIVAFSWLDEYGQPKRGQVQIGGGQIASPRLDLSQAKFIAPVKNLAIVSCQ